MVSSVPVSLWRNDDSDDVSTPVQVIYAIVILLRELVRELRLPEGIGL